MKIFLCINSKTNKACVFHTEFTFEELKSYLEKYGHTAHMPLPGKFSSTNWCGCDDIERILMYKKLKLSEKNIEYTGKYEGIDSDMGHTFPFTFVFDKMVLCKKDIKNIRI